jgi:hypothetical protein
MAECEGSTKASVILSSPNKRINIKNPPIKVKCTSPDGNIIMVAGMGVDFDWSAKYVELSYTDTNGVKDDNYSLQTVECKEGVGCGSNSPNPNASGRFYQARIFKNGNFQHAFPVIGWYSVGLKSVVKIRAKFTIESAEGKVFEEEFDKCPPYKVECDDQCPEGEMKMKSDRPPGYCCISCSELKAGLSAIKARIR